MPFWGVEVQIPHEQGCALNENVGYTTHSNTFDSLSDGQITQGIKRPFSIYQFIKQLLLVTEAVSI